MHHLHSAAADKTMWDARYHGFVFWFCFLIILARNKWNTTVFY